jgi:hypothetical protein
MCRKLLQDFLIVIRERPLVEISGKLIRQSQASLLYIIKEEVSSSFLRKSVQFTGLLK